MYMDLGYIHHRLRKGAASGLANQRDGLLQTFSVSRQVFA
jgi:hypothetical protein